MFVGVFIIIITDSILFLAIGQLNLSISSLLSFGKLMFLENCPFLLGYQICWQIIMHSNFLTFLVFLQYQLWFTFHFLPSFFWVFSLFFLVSLAKGLLILFTFSMK